MTELENLKGWVDKINARLTVLEHRDQHTIELSKEVGALKKRVEKLEERSEQLQKQIRSAVNP